MPRPRGWGCQRALVRRRRSLRRCRSPQPPPLAFCVPRADGRARRRFILILEHKRLSPQLCAERRTRVDVTYVCGHESLDERGGRLRRVGRIRSCCASALMLLVAALTLFSRRTSPLRIRLRLRARRAFARGRRRAIIRHRITK